MAFLGVWEVSLWHTVLIGLSLSGRLGGWVERFARTIFSGDIMVPIELARVASK